MGSVFDEALPALSDPRSSTSCTSTDIMFRRTSCVAPTFFNLWQIQLLSRRVDTG